MRGGEVLVLTDESGNKQEVALMDTVEYERETYKIFTTLAELDKAQKKYSVVKVNRGILGNPEEGELFESIENPELVSKLLKIFTERIKETSGSVINKAAIALVKAIRKLHEANKELSGLSGDRTELFANECASLEIAIYYLACVPATSTHTFMKSDDFINIERSIISDSSLDSGTAVKRIFELKPDVIKPIYDKKIQGAVSHTAVVLHDVTGMYVKLSKSSVDKVNLKPLLDIQDLTYEALAVLTGKDLSKFYKGADIRKVITYKGMKIETIIAILMQWCTPQNSDNAASKSVKIGRNDSCPCGSGKKYKKCCSARQDTVIIDDAKIDANELYLELKSTGRLDKYKERGSVLKFCSNYADLLRIDSEKCKNLGKDSVFDNVLYEFHSAGFIRGFKHAVNVTEWGKEIVPSIDVTTEARTQIPDVSNWYEVLRNECWDNIVSEFTSNYIYPAMTKNKAECEKLIADIRLVASDVSRAGFVSGFNFIVETAKIV